MILNANIPLQNSSTRHILWRVGAFCAAGAGGIFMGFILAATLAQGITFPVIRNASGITLRLLPRQRLWIEKHLGGFSISESCPLDLAYMMRAEKPEWLIVSDAGTSLSVTLRKPSHSLNTRALTHSFSCKIQETAHDLVLENQGPQTFAHRIHLRPANLYAWTVNNIAPGMLVNGKSPKISFRTSLRDIFPTTKLPWPQVPLTTAVPINASPSLIPIPNFFPGINALQEHHAQGAFFKWTTDTESQFALLFSGKIDETITKSFLEDLVQTPTNSILTNRIDGATYHTITKEPLIFTQTEPERIEATLTNGKLVGIITTNDQFTHISTADIFWAIQKPLWQITRSATQDSPHHTPRTLTHFGNEAHMNASSITVLLEKVIH